MPSGVLAIGLLALVGLVGASLLDGSPPSVDGGPGRRRPARGPREQRKWSGVDVAVVRLALDVAGAPRGLSSVAPRTLTDLDAARLRSLALELRHAREQWTHLGGASHKPMSPAMAEGLFEQASDAAARMLSVQSATADAPADGYRAPVRGTQSVVVLVVASKEEIRDFDAASASALSSTLAGLERTRNDALVSADVIWAPFPAGPEAPSGLGLAPVGRAQSTRARAIVRR